MAIDRDGCFGGAEPLPPPVRILTCGDRYVAIVSRNQAKGVRSTSLVVAYGHHTVGRAAASEYSTSTSGCTGLCYTLDCVRVEPAFRRRGLGRLLVRLLEHQLLLDAPPVWQSDPVAQHASLAIRLECDARSRAFFCHCAYDFPGQGLVGWKALPLGERCRCGGCADGWLSARMRERMVAAADLEGEALLDLIQETEGAVVASAPPAGHPAPVLHPYANQPAAGASSCWPLHGSALECALAEVPSLRCLPEAVRRKHLNRLFLQGYAECFFTVCETLRQRRLPSIHAVLINWQSEAASVAARNYFLDHGGSVQLVLHHMLLMSYRELTTGGGESGRWMDSEQLPTCPNDLSFGLVALHLLGPGYDMPDAREGSGATHGGAYYGSAGEEEDGQHSAQSSQSGMAT